MIELLLDENLNLKLFQKCIYFFVIMLLMISM